MHLLDLRVTQPFTLSHQSTKCATFRFPTMTPSVSKTYQDGGNAYYPTRAAKTLLQRRIRRPSTRKRREQMQAHISDSVL